MFLWFKQKRMEHIPVSGTMLCEKAVQLSSQLNGDEAKFVASEGWKWRLYGRGQPEMGLARYYSVIRIFHLSDDLLLLLGPQLFG